MIKTTKILPFFGILLLFILPVNAQIITNILPQGRITITTFQAPNTVNIETSFPVNITIQNNRLLPARIMIRLDFLDGLLNLLQKDIGETQSIVLRGKTSKTIQINCIIREGDTDWYKEEYNIQATLLQKIPLLGWTTRDVSSVRGIHVQSPLSQNNKIHIVHLQVPETLSEDQTSFTITLQVANLGTMDTTTWAQVNLIEKPSVIPVLDQFYNIRGLGAELKELGRSTEKQITTGEIETFTISCYLRETERTKEQFTIEAVVYMNLSGQQVLADTSTMQGIYHKQPFLQQHYLEIIAAVFGILIAIFLVIFIIRIIYPAYYIKKRKLRDEKRRLQKKKKPT